ncbi:MAG: hypothetical protein QOE44_988 [Solirubrobacteraceae bacterium]|nr:hypothetical protein [Solirubrobacteraceae bacterium]
MAVHTSALLVVLLGEPERDRFISPLVEADDPAISEAALFEGSILMQARIGDDGLG